MEHHCELKCITQNVKHKDLSICEHMHDTLSVYLSHPGLLVFACTMTPFMTQPANVAPKRPSPKLIYITAFSQLLSLPSLVSILVDEDYRLHHFNPTETISYCVK